MNSEIQFGVYEHLVVCPGCGQFMSIHRGIGPYYRCSGYPQCDWSHPAGPDGTPRGTAADGPTREARKDGHGHFDWLWRRGGMSRTQAYGWLANAMGIPEEEAHFACFTKEQCRKAIREVKAFRRGRGSRRVDRKGLMVHHPGR